MERIAIIGELDLVGKKTLQEHLGNNFELIEISIDEHEKLAKADYIILRSKMDRVDISHASKAKLIQRWGVGYDFVDIKAAGEKGIQVGITTGANSSPVAEYTVLMMLAVYRQLVNSHNATVSGRWKQETSLELNYMLKGKNIGIIGFGNIGRKVAKILKGFGSNIYYYDVCPLLTGEEIALDVEYRSFEDIITCSDIISIHTPLTKSTKHLISKNEIEKMRSTAILVNTSRGGLINEIDLYEALKNNVIMGAGLDVFESEPPMRDNPLFKLKNIVVSSHIAGNTLDNSETMAKKCIENILKVSKGEILSPPDLVNLEFMKSEVLI